MNKIKICYLTDTWFPIVGGGPQACWNFAKKLALNYNCSVDIITRNLIGEQDRDLEHIKGISIIKLGPKTKWNSLLGRFIFTVQSFLFILTHNYDLIHAFPFISGISAYIAAKVKNTKVVFSIFTAASLLERFLCFLIPYDLLITDNLKIKKKYKNRNLIYIPNGVDIKLFNSVKITKHVKNRIIFVGRFRKQKGIDTFLKASLFVIKKIPDMKIVLIGYGNELNNIISFIKRHNLSNNYYIKPPIYERDLVKEYKLSCALVLPSNYEGQGIVVFEAWAARIPVVATRVGSLGEIVKNGVNGFLVSKNKPKELAAAIIRILNSKVSKGMGRQGYELVKNQYTWDKSVAKLYKCYLHLI